MVNSMADQPEVRAEVEAARRLAEKHLAEVETADIPVAVIRAAAVPAAAILAEGIPEAEVLVEAAVEAEEDIPVARVLAEVVAVQLAAVPREEAEDAGTK
jgi:hypothetical protein